MTIGVSEVCPNPAKISDLWASTAISLFTCDFRLACEMDPQIKRYQRGSEHTAIGTVIHDLRERVFNDDQFKSGNLEEEWENLITSARKELCEEWGTNKIPPYRHWRYYQVKRAEALSALRVTLEKREMPQRIGRASRATPEHYEEKTFVDLERQEGQSVEPPTSQSGSTSVNELLGLEIRLQDLEKKITGKADKISKTSNNKIRISDLKTGEWKGEPTESNKIQLLIYAFLFHSETAKWPDELGIEETTDEFHEIPYTPQEAVNLVSELIEKRGLFNERIASSDLEFQANPTRENCKNCSFKVVCANYWEVLSEDWGHYSLAGKIERNIDQSEELRIVSPSDSRLDVIPLPNPKVLEERNSDHKFLLIDNYKTQHAGIVMKWNTLARYSE